ncbi:phosphoacetylglucosamine mutase [Neodiprion fabricii]|uniref:phosphoacetylglucosamine mutase n=1 Tax=Neodiprion fabricii TaxID=2872261 RepID=UPI001ED8C165|nr:phosphoacetylglucosamine mutase [Neodiprion fabricii]
MDVTSIETAKSLHPKTYDGHIQYGTAGFRTRSEILDHVMFRMGLLAVLRSKSKRAAIGLMITASHNEEPDNGVKLVDPAGEMLEASWEKLATELANVEDAKLVSTLQNIVSTQNIDINAPANVVVGRDTRQSSPRLATAAVDGIKALQGMVNDFAVITTPQLHYLVVCLNTNESYGIATLHGYYQKLSNAFKEIRGSSPSYKNYTPNLVLDGANGVGAIAVREFQKYLGDSIQIELYNDGSGKLNYMCGADFVKVQQTQPMNVPQQQNVRCASIDGDADRVVYYYTDGQNKFHLLDGDRIATLIASYFKELLQESGLDLQLGLVQTAYANGGSTDYISKILKIPVACVPTGVKHLHHKALDFDIGVYFEANGHGTVTFKESALGTIRSAIANLRLSETARSAASKLLNAIEVINQTVGDALSDVLIVETILHSKGWSLADWEKSYTDLPNKQLKVKVRDRNVISTVDAERKCVTPAGLQERIDTLVATYPRGRSFVRPSGTEDLVRVYAEGQSVSEVQKLAAEVSLAVYELAGGIGPIPIVPN